MLFSIAVFTVSVPHSAGVSIVSLTMSLNQSVCRTQLTVPIAPPKAVNIIGNLLLSRPFLPILAVSKSLLPDVFCCLADVLEPFFCGSSLPLLAPKALSITLLPAPLTLSQPLLKKFFSYSKLISSSVNTSFFNINLSSSVNILSLPSSDSIVV